LDQLLRVNQVAEWLDLSEDRVYSLIREGYIPAVKLNRTIRVSREAMEQLIEEGGTALPESRKSGTV